MKNLYHLLAITIGSLFIACSESRQDTESNPSDVVALELIDSLIVDELSPMTLQDVNLESGKALLVAKSKNVFLTDLKGEVFNEYSLSNDGPDGVGGSGAFGYKFLGNDKFVAQGFFTSYFVYDFEGKQVKKVPYNTDQLYRIMLYRNRTTFHPYRDGDQMMMIGEEHNFFSDEEMDPTVLGTKFYEKISSVYRYNMETEENEILESFPSTWEPRVNNRYVGSKTSFVALHDSKKSFALLPLQGSQVFFYDLGKEVTLKGEVQLQHPARPQGAPTISSDSNSDYSDFPSFSNVLYAGDYCLIQFFSTIPAAKVSELKALSEQYFTTPEYKEASKQYVRPYFILVKSGKQIGIINELPVNGTVEFLDKNGVIYINDNISPKVERDYNVFYKVKIKE